MSDPVITVITQPTVVRLVSTDQSTTVVSSSTPVTVVSSDQNVNVLSEAVTPITVLAAQSISQEFVTAGSIYLGKTLTWAQGLLTEVLLYLDAAKTQLAERRVLNRTGGTLTSIDFFDGAGTLTKTRTLGYSSGVLTSVTEA